MPHEAVTALLWLDQIVPVVAGIQQLHPVFEDQDVVVTDIGRTGFEQAHRDIRILRQPGRQDTPGRAAPYDDVIEFTGRHCLAA